MAPFYGWGSTASRLEPLRGGSLKLYGPFLRMGFNCLKARATSRRSISCSHTGSRFTINPFPAWETLLEVYGEVTNKTWNDIGALWCLLLENSAFYSLDFFVTLNIFLGNGQRPTIKISTILVKTATLSSKFSASHTLFSYQ